MILTPPIMLKAPYSSLSLLFGPLKRAQIIYNIFVSYKKTKRKNSWCDGLCSAHLVRSMRSLVGLWIWDDCSLCALTFPSLVIFVATRVVSRLPSSREFNHEFKTPADNIVSLFTYKILRIVVCEVNWCSKSVGSSKEEVLDTSQVGKEYLGMKELFDENPLRRWEPLGRVWISSQNFNVPDVKYLDLLGNEKEKEEEHLRGAVRHGSTWLFLQCKVIYCDPIYLFFRCLFHFLFCFSFLFGPHELLWEKGVLR